MLVEPMKSTREEWLTEAVRLLEVAVFQNTALVGKKILKMPDKWQVTCGWCKGMTARGVGMCVDPVCSKDGTTHLFVVPTQEDPMSILGTLAHEMGHAIVGIKEAHKGKFVEATTLIGLVGKPTQCTIGPGTIAWTAAEKVLSTLGPYPHAAMVPRAKPTKPSPWIRWRSKSMPKFTVLANTKQVAKYGLPRDPKGEEMMPVDASKVFGIKQDPRQERLPNVDAKAVEPDDSDSDE